MEYMIQTIKRVVQQNKLILKVIFLLIILPCVFSLPALANYSLKKQDIQNLKVNFTKDEGGYDYISIEGIPFHSALVATQFLVNDNENYIHIDVKLEPAKKKRGLPFYLKLKIRDKIEYITLGNNNDIIWRR